MVSVDGRDCRVGHRGSWRHHRARFHPARRAGNQSGDTHRGGRINRRSNTDREPDADREPHTNHESHADREPHTNHESHGTRDSPGH